MAVVRRVPLVLVALVAVAVAAASTGCADDAPAPPGAAADDDVVAGAEPRCGTLDAVLATADACVDLVGARGRWRAAPGGATSTSAVCTFVWSGAAAPDGALVEGLGERLLAVDSACVDLARTAREAELESLDLPPDASHGGMHGCDVCGRLRPDRRGWAVFPPAKAPFGSIEVKLDDGSVRWFAVRGADAKGPVSFTLPAPPAGRTWAAGTVKSL